VCVEAVVKCSPSCQHLWHSGRSFVGFNDVEDGFEELYRIVTGSAEVSWVLEGEEQGCVDALREFFFPYRS
jgi:hypothetical protein